MVKIMRQERRGGKEEEEEEEEEGQLKVKLTYMDFELSGGVERLYYNMGLCGVWRRESHGDRIQRCVEERES